MPAEILSGRRLSKLPDFYHEGFARTLADRIEVARQPNLRPGSTRTGIISTQSWPCPPLRPKLASDARTSVRVSVETLNEPCYR